MIKETRTVCFDERLKIEAYRFEGMAKPFPNHFHEHYVIGFMESGKRHMNCRNRQYIVKNGDILIFNPGDNHACQQDSGGFMDYRGLNIPQDIMAAAALEITGRKGLPRFLKNVITDSEAGFNLYNLHRLIMEGSGEFEKEEKFILLISALISKYAEPFDGCVPECQDEVKKTCDFIEKNYNERISLDDICAYAGMSKSTLLRAFTKTKGITPYRYLETVRINEAKKLLEAGVTPLEAAMRTGFSDQAHFANFFNMFTGLAPGVYRSIFGDKKGGN
ncbi:AraC family transcriptional regulator [Lachnospiraceae bacterium NSJ-143]|nr:AraC family transcriptional regulator [Lachnospiraceae bacterium NSJ-143]